MYRVTPATPKVISSQGFAWARGKAHFFPPQRAFSPPVRLICALNYDRCRRCSCHRSHGPGKNSLVALQNPGFRAVLAINGTLFPEYWDCGDKIKTLFLFFLLYFLRRRWLFVVIVVGLVNLILHPASRHVDSILGSGHARVLAGDIHTKKEEDDLGWKWIVSLLKFTSEHFFTAFTVGCFCIRLWPREGVVGGLCPGLVGMQLLCLQGDWNYCFNCLLFLWRFMLSAFAHGFHVIGFDARCWWSAFDHWYRIAFLFAYV